MKIANILGYTDEGGASTVQADVDGEMLWFKSQDVTLSPSPEVFGSALLIPAAHRSESLEIDGVLDPVWTSNVGVLNRKVSDWWGIPDVKINSSPEPAGSSHDPQGAKHAQCFSGGVDSFHSLLTSGLKVDALIYVIGFDIALDDSVRINDYLPRLRGIGEEVGSQVIVIRTNLRRHPSFRQTNWERTHGGALAAIGHLLEGEFKSFLIPSGHTTDRWGSHWEIDRFWSSSAVNIVHGDASFQRVEKLRAIGCNTLVLRNLRVCWENRAPLGNCSNCEKCCRTMISLYSADLLQSCETFDNIFPLEQRVDRLEKVPAHLLETYRALYRDLEGGSKAAVREAVARLIDRSAPTLRDKVVNVGRRMFMLFRKSLLKLQRH